MISRASSSVVPRELLHHHGAVPAESVLSHQNGLSIWPRVIQVGKAWGLISRLGRTPWAVQGIWDKGKILLTTPFWPNLLASLSPTASSHQIRTVIWTWLQAC